MSNEDNTSLQDEALAANFGDLTTQSEGTDAVEESWLVHRSDLEFLPKPRREQREAEEAAAKATEAANVPEGEKAEADQSGLEEGELEESGEEDQIGIVMNEPDHEPYEDAEAVDAPEEDGELEESGEEDQIGIVMNGPDHEPYPDAEAVNFPDDRDADEPDNEATSSTLNDEPSTSHQSRLPRSIALTREQSTSKSDSFSRLNDPKSIPRTDEQSTNVSLDLLKLDC
ncbi:hypothetical protein Ddc_10026 [Ditylenchus destructor]|nr:hypothetical protein Ddc_10026 [Ditylenchus destructor]